MSQRTSSEHSTSRSALSDSYARNVERAKARSAAQVLLAQEIAPLPAVADVHRRIRADRNFQFFCETYFPAIFHLAWSEDHLRVLAMVERAVRKNETLAIAMPRGFGKTSICLAAALWAAVTGLHEYVMLIAASEDKAKNLLRNLKSMIRSSWLLAADYPGAIVPFLRIDGEARRCRGQRFYGRVTDIGWAEDEIVFASIPGDPASGAVIRVSGIEGNLRGAIHIRRSGRSVRPSLALVDDPQTDESSASLVMTQNRLSIVKGAIRGLGGAKNPIGVLMPCTVINKGDLADQILDRATHPEWHGERTKLVYSFPTAEKTWAEYARLLREELANGGDGSLAAGFYIERRAEMDAGARVAWSEWYGRNEVSAIQSAMNLKIRDELSFWAEYQNEPIDARAEAPSVLSASGLLKKVNGLECGAVPSSCHAITAYVDVQGQLLYWMVVAWTDAFAGYVLDYGTHPDQHRAYFSLRDARRTLEKAYPGTGLEGRLYAGLTDLCHGLLARELIRDDGAVMKVDRTLVDANWGESTDTIYEFCRHADFAGRVIPSHGKFIGASSVPFSEYRPRRGERLGYHWLMPLVRGHRAIRYVVIDVNFWKSFVAARLTMALGDDGALSIFMPSRDRSHQMLFDHWLAERPIRVEGRGRIVDEWKSLNKQNDNHWWDCLVGAAVAASTIGVSVTAGGHVVGRSRRERKRYSASDLSRRGAA